MIKSNEDGMGWSDGGENGSDGDVGDPISLRAQPSKRRAESR